MHIDPEHHLEPRKSGHRTFDVVITVCILLVSISSLVIALVHSRTLERMADANTRLVETNSWPFLAYTTSNSTSEGRIIEMGFANQGVGPAKVESVQLKWNGKAYPDAIGFLGACCGYKYAPWTTGLSTSVPTGVYRAGDRELFFSLPDKPGNAAAWSKLNLARTSRSLSVIVCYCSVFDECWQNDIARYSLTPHPVQRCDVTQPNFGANGP
jgi:hypothetical protein